MNWLIIRTDFRKEHYVAAQIRNAGFDAWVPCEARTHRICRHVKRRETTYHPILPRRIFAKLSIGYLDELTKIRHLDGIETNADGVVLYVPDCQIVAFKSEIDRENTAILALSQSASKKQKAKWRSLHDALVELIDSAKQHLEAAA